MASTTFKQTCAKCNKGGGIAMCNGCQQSFCIKHFVEHRQELSQLMDNIGQEHDLLQRDLNYETYTHLSFARIDQWKQESIKIIQVTAKKARDDFQQVYNRAKNELKTSIGKLTAEIQICRESDDYTEIDINKWIEQLKDLRQILENPSIINTEYDNNSKSVISLIKVDSSLSSAKKLRTNENDNRTTENPVPSSKERFDQIYGNITLSTDGFTGRCSGSRWDGSCISGFGRYSSKTHHIRFRIEKLISNYLFFGIITGSEELKSSISESKSAYGWWDFSHIIANGKIKERNSTKTIRSDDEITIILDCDNRQILLEYHRTDKLTGLPVDLDQCPFPWKIVVRLDSERDCMKILH